MCKTYEAIYDLAKRMKSDVLICSLNHLKIEGTLHKCDDNEGKCYENIITLKDATVTCPHTDYKQEYKWINISSKYIQAFAFKCCKKDN